MKVLWPVSLAFLGLIPLIIGIYFWVIRRRKRFALRYSSLSLVREAVERQSRLRRYLPMALFLLALASLVFALARPVAVTIVPAGQATVILSIDVSRSMLQDDITPYRLKAAQDAALSFVRSRTANTQIGIVAFAGYAQLVQPPTTDQEDLQEVIESLTTGRGTAIGSGILAGVDAIAELNRGVAPIGGNPGESVAPTPVPEGVYAPDIVVLLTDGVPTTGPLPEVAAEQAANRGVRVYTIGFGTERGGVMPYDFGGGGGGFSGGGGGGFGGGRFRRGIDEAMLKNIAALTGGEYYSATSAGELQKVFESLPTYLITREETEEITVLFAALSALTALAAIVLGMLWHPLP